MMPKSQNVYARYVGEGRYVFGVPARDLSKAEWNSLSKERQNFALEAGTHVIEASAPKPKKSPPGDENDDR
jgi:hypothetical protein